MKTLLYLAIVFMLFACSSATPDPDAAKMAAGQPQDFFALRGDYHWKFQLMGTNQHSTHVLFADSIQYRMKGIVYSTDYTMKKLSYDQSTDKWIGQDENNIVYVMFFKDQTDSTLTIYKHKCKTGGIKEAIEFQLPPDDATADHGWNVYSTTVDEPIDILPINGEFVSLGNQLSISDSLVVYNGQTFNKMSYHAGERRWVGEAGEIYLQLFFENLTSPNEMRISVETFSDLEIAYRKKYEEATFDVLKITSN